MKRLIFIISVCLFFVTLEKTYASPFDREAIIRRRRLEERFIRRRQFDEEGDVWEGLDDELLEEEEREPDKNYKPRRRKFRWEGRGAQRRRPRRDSMRRTRRFEGYSAGVLMSPYIAAIGGHSPEAVTGGGASEGAWREYVETLERMERERRDTTDWRYGSEAREGRDGELRGSDGSTLRSGTSGGSVTERERLADDVHGEAGEAPAAEEVTVTGRASSAGSAGVRPEDTVNEAVVDGGLMGSSAGTHVWHTASVAATPRRNTDTHVGVGSASTGAGAGTGMPRMALVVPGRVQVVNVIVRDGDTARVASVIWREPEAPRPPLATSAAPRPSLALATGAIGDASAGSEGGAEEKNKAGEVCECGCGPDCPCGCGRGHGCMCGGPRRATAAGVRGCRCQDPTLAAAANSSATTATATVPALAPAAMPGSGEKPAWTWGGNSFGSGITFNQFLQLRTSDLDSDIARVCARMGRAGRHSAGESRSGGDEGAVRVAMRGAAAGALAPLQLLLLAHEHSLDNMLAARTRTSISTQPYRHVLGSALAGVAPVAAALARRSSRGEGDAERESAGTAGSAAAEADDATSASSHPSSSSAFSPFSSPHASAASALPAATLPASGRTMSTLQLDSFSSGGPSTTPTGDSTGALNVAGVGGATTLNRSGLGIDPMFATGSGEVAIARRRMFRNLYGDSAGGRWSGITDLNTDRFSGVSRSRRQAASAPAEEEGDDWEPFPRDYTRGREGGGARSTSLIARYREEAPLRQRRRGMRDRRDRDLRGRRPDVYGVGALMAMRRGGAGFNSASVASNLPRRSIRRRLVEGGSLRGRWVSDDFSETPARLRRSMRAFALPN